MGPECFLAAHVLCVASARLQRTSEYVRPRGATQLPPTDPRLREVDDGAPQQRKITMGADGSVTISWAQLSGSRQSSRVPPLSLTHALRRLNRCDQSIPATRLRLIGISLGLGGTNSTVAWGYSEDALTEVAMGSSAVSYTCQDSTCGGPK